MLVNNGLGVMFMEIVRYLNGNEISKEALYLQRYVSEEMKAAMKDVRSRMYAKAEETDERKEE